MTTLTPPADAPLPILLARAIGNGLHLPLRFAPWPAGDCSGDIVDAAGSNVVDLSDASLGEDAARYLVAAANAAPGLVAERDRWQTLAYAAKDALRESERLRAAERAEFEEALKEPAAEMAGMLDNVVVAKLATLTDERDTALARVAALEAENARLSVALATFNPDLDDGFDTHPCHVCGSPPGVRCDHDEPETP